MGSQSSRHRQSVRSCDCDDMRYPNVVPIPGSKNKERIIENLDSANVELTDAEFEQLETELNRCKVYGHRGLGGL